METSVRDGLPLFSPLFYDLSGKESKKDKKIKVKKEKSSKVKEEKKNKKEVLKAEKKKEKEDKKKKEKAKKEKKEKKSKKVKEAEKPTLEAEPVEEVIPEVTVGQLGCNVVCWPPLPPIQTNEGIPSLHVKRV